MKKLLLLILLFVFFSNFNAFAIIFPCLDPDYIYESPPKLTFTVNNSNYYNYQFDLNFNLFPYNGYYKDIFANKVVFTYSPRIVLDNKLNHQFKFYLYEVNNLFYNCILDYGEDYSDPRSGEYLFNFSGFKILEWDNTDIFNELNIVKFSTELLIENRPYRESNQRFLPCLHYKPNDHNFYLKEIVSIELSKKNIDKQIFTNKRMIDGFWDVPIGSYTEFGYDWTKEIKTIEKIDGIPKVRYYTNKSSIFIFLDFNYSPINYMKLFEYGIKSKFDFHTYPFNINFAYRKTNCYLDNDIFSFDNYTAGFTFWLR